MPQIFIKISRYWQSNAEGALLRAFAAFIIIVLAVVVGRMVASAVGRALQRGHATNLASLFASLVKLVIFLAGLVAALDQLGVNVAALVASAGIVGLALGFGAQTLVKDVISGFFLIFDNVLSPGDNVAIGEVQGEVEAVSLRQTQVRSFNGQLWYIPNSEIKTVANFNRGFARAVVDVTVALEHDGTEVIKILQAIGDDYAKEKSTWVLGNAEAQGFIALSSQGLTVRLIVRVAATRHSAVERELRQRIKVGLEKAGIKFAAPLRELNKKRRNSSGGKR